MRLNLNPVRRFAFLAPLLLMSLSAQAQLSPDARVSLITLYPGDAIYSLWGHSAIHIEDPVLGLDVAYNFGTFDFGNPVSFLARFAYGRLDYMLSLENYRLWVDYSWYTQKRAVIEQTLNLTQAQKDSLFEFLTWNSRPENRTYRYDFLYDNCATRIRDALEPIIGSPLAADTPAGIAFRTAVKPYARQHPLVDLAMNLGMGMPADQMATRREQAFLPLDLASIAAEARKPDGQVLVLRTDTLYGQPMPPTQRTSVPWTAALFGLGLAWGIVLTGLQRTKPRRHVTDLALFTVAGAIGLLLAFLSLVSLHTVTWPNLHLLWAWPAHGIIIWLRRPWTRYYWMASAAGLSIFLAGLPLWTQGIPTAVLPLVVLLLVRSTALACVPRTGFEPVLPA